MKQAKGQDLMHWHWVVPPLAWPGSMRCQNWLELRARETPPFPYIVAVPLQTCHLGWDRGKPHDMMTAEVKYARSPLLPRASTAFTGPNQSARAACDRQINTVRKGRKCRSTQYSHLCTLHKHAGSACNSLETR
jgi:hypothetical protein